MLVGEGFNAITSEIIGGAIEVHRHLGPGLLESTYLSCLQDELSDRELRFATQRSLPVVYKGRTLDTAYRADLIVEDLVVIELKSVDQLLPVHQSQVLTYLRLANCPVGLLINFKVAKLSDGVKRLLRPRRNAPP